MKEKIIRYGLIVFSIVVLILAFTQAGEAPYHISYYDFNNSIYGSYQEIAYYEVDVYPPSFTFGGTNISAADYINLQNIDNNVWSHPDEGSNFEPVIRFNFTINENPVNIDWIYITVYGNEDESGAQEIGSCFIANFSSSEFSKIFDLPYGILPQLRTYNITSNPSDYIDTNSNLIVACAGNQLDLSLSLRIDYVSITIGNSTPSAPTATLDVSLNEPANASSFELEFTNIIFNATTDISDGTIHNMTLYHNFSGTWQFNQSNQSTITDNVKYSFDTALSHSIAGEYIWGVQSCSVSGICNWSVNYTIMINESNDILDITLNQPADTSSYELSFSGLEFNATVDITDGIIHNATLYHNFSGTWQFNQTNQSTITDAVKYSFDDLLSNSVVGEYIWGVHACSVNDVCNWSSNYTISITASDDILAVTLDEPSDGSDYTNSFTDLNFNATCDVTDGIIHNLTLYHNLSGTWQFNQTNQSTVSDNVKYTFDDALSHSTTGNYSWGVQCCSTNDICNWSTNYSLTISELNTRTFEVIQWANNPTTTSDGEEWIFRVNISCTGTQNCGAMSATLDPFKIEPLPSTEQTQMTINQWQSCYLIEKSKYILTKNETVKFPNGTTTLNQTWTYILYNHTHCDKIPIYNISTTNNKEQRLLNMTHFGKCSYNSTCIECDSKLDGNGDGTCNSGESCYRYCGTTEKLVTEKKFDTKESSYHIIDIIK